MSTSYIISLGYGSDSEENWKWLKATVKSIRPCQLQEEYLKYDDVVVCEKGCCTLKQFAEHYTHCQDATLIIDDDKKFIQQFASGGGLQRKMKEGLRRAVCRLVLHEAHARHIEISIEVG